MDRTTRRHRRVAVATVGTASVLAALLAPAPASAEADFQRASHPAAGNSFIVSLKEGAGTASASAIESVSASLVDRYGGALAHTFTASMHGFQVTGLSDSDARKLAADSRVKKVYQDGTARAFDTQPNATWGIDRVDQKDLPLDQKYTYPGDGAANVTVYNTDTGIRVSHQEFEGRATASAEADFVGDGKNGIDCSGHGSHTSGTIGGKTWGIAKKVKLVSVRMLGENCGDSAPDSAGVKAIEWITKNAKKPAVVNASWGFDTADIGDDAIAAMTNSGILMVAASGNNGADNCGFGPGKIPEVLAVNATSKNDARAGFSNYGKCSDIFAPGDQITSVGIASDTASANNQGTSMAAPHVTGAAAIYLAAHPNASPAEVTKAILDNATPGKVTNAGANSPNKLLYTVFAGGGEPGGCANNTGSNTDDVAIPDNSSAVTSTITMAQCSGNAAAGSSVKVDINHTFGWDLKVEVVGPSGKAYQLKAPGGGNFYREGVHETYQVDLSGETRNGAWKLQVTDTSKYDSGTIDGWSLTL